MRKFLINTVLFFLLTLVVGELVVRITHAVSDIPQRTIDIDGIQKYLPNQDGYWKGGEHQWTINAFGWPGELPSNFDNLVVLIGDSYIENFMNPNECHQSAFLKKKLSDYNFMEAARSGVSLIEAMEISKQLDSLRPVHTLVYVNDNDFYESIREIEPLNDITQLSLTEDRVVHGEMKSPKIKKILYNWKLAYYMYNRFPLNDISEKAEDPIKDRTEAKQIKSKNKVQQLLQYIKNHYDIQDKTFVFHPGTNETLIAICRDIGFNIITLDSSQDKSWTFDYDTHWTCYGHEKAAEQVASGLLKNSLILKR